MARASFTLRKSDLGSLLRDPDLGPLKDAVLLYDLRNGSVHDGVSAGVNSVPNLGSAGSAFDLYDDGSGGAFTGSPGVQISDWALLGGLPGDSPWSVVEVLGADPVYPILTGGRVVFSQSGATPDLDLFPDADGDFGASITMGSPDYDKDIYVDDSTAGSNTAFDVRIIQYDPTVGVASFYINNVLFVPPGSPYQERGMVVGSYPYFNTSEINDALPTMYTYLVVTVENIDDGGPGPVERAWNGVQLFAVTRTLLTEEERVAIAEYFAGPVKDYDSALRANGVQLPPATSDLITGNSFSAVPITYGSVKLDWAAPLSSTLGVSPTPTAALVVYSHAGIPQTIGSGTVLYEGAGINTFTQTELTQGQWAYYSLFLHFQSTGGDNYYEKVAELEVLVPTDYGSVLQLWNGVPGFYRGLDTAQGTYATDDVLGVVALSHFGYSVQDGSVVVTGDKIGPLFRFLSVIGFDMDYMRTLTDYVMVSRDPEVANSETLNALAGMLGIPLTTDDLGGARLRGVLESIGILRRSKGTLSGIGIFANALAGSNVVLNADSHDFSVNSQRVNYIMSPKTGAGSVEWRPAHEDEVLDPLPFSYSGYVAYTNDISHVGTSWSLVANAHGIIGALIHITDMVPVLYNDFVSLSFHKELNCSCIQWARLTDPSGNLVGSSYDVRIINGFPYIEIPVTDNADYTTFTNCTVDFMVDLSVMSTFVGENYLLEVNYVGEYFDGDTIRGGWLTSSPSASDYRWVGTANSSWSVYAEDYKRTTGAVKSLLPTVLPITEELKYQVIEYNGVRGFPLHRTPTSVELEDGSGIILTEDGFELNLYDSIGL